MEIITNEAQRFYADTGFKANRTSYDYIVTQYFKAIEAHSECTEKYKRNRLTADKREWSRLAKRLDKILERKAGKKRKLAAIIRDVA